MRHYRKPPVNARHAHRRWPAAAAGAAAAAYINVTAWRRVRESERESGRAGEGEAQNKCEAWTEIKGRHFLFWLYAKL